MALRQFIFFGQDDKVLFVRTDAEQAGWQVDEYSLTCLFPYDPNRRIVQGMRIGFEDDSGILQPFEVRKVKTYEPDHYQELTCEHIAIAELTDYHTDESEIDNQNPQYALSAVLASQPSTVQGSQRWQIGTVTATATSSGDIGLGSIWQNIRNIEKNWNCYIIPRVTFNSAGITGRYLDIYPAGGTWQGLRLSIEKNTDEAGVTVDDTNVKTALYGYGGQRNDTQTYDDPTRTKITLEGYTWPDKPSGAVVTGGYIEDTAATAAYGRNGQPRFGFYQNGDITDQHTLAVKTWEALQATNKPEVTIDCLLRDLYRMGYHDEPIRLHDTALVELRPNNDILQLEIVKLFVDLLDPTATRPTIGTYIPNIIYIQRQVAEQANGASGSISGRRGGETKTDDEWSEFTSGFDYSNLLLHLHAEQIDRSNSILQQAGMSIDAQGVIIYANDNVNNIQSKIDVQAGRITQEVTDRSNADATLTSSIQQEANKISLIVQNVGANGTVTAASIITSIDNDSSGVTITADHIQITGNTGILGALQVEGVVVADDIFSASATHKDVYCNTLTTDSNIYCDYDLIMSSTSDITTGTITANGLVECNYGLDVTGTASADSMETGTLSVDGVEIDANAVKSFGTATESSGQISIPYYTFASGTRQAGTINFNIAATQYFIDEMAAAELRGWNAACDMVTRVSNTIYGPQKNSYGNYTQKYRANYSSSSYSASSHSHSGAWMKIDGVPGTYRSDATVNLTNFNGKIQFNSGYDSYSPSSYSASSFSWTTY